MYLEIGGEKLFIDFEQLNTMLTSGDPSLKAGDGSESEVKETFGSDGLLIGKKVVTNHFTKPRVIDGFRYEILMQMIQKLMDSESEADSLGKVGFDNFTVGEIIAFNTLIEYKVLNIIE